MTGRDRTRRSKPSVAATPCRDFPSRDLSDPNFRANPFRAVAATPSHTAPNHAESPTAITNRTLPGLQILNEYFDLRYLLSYCLQVCVNIAGGCECTRAIRSNRAHNVFNAGFHTG